MTATNMCSNFGNKWCSSPTHTKKQESGSLAGKSMMYADKFIDDLIKLLTCYAAKLIRMPRTEQSVDLL